MSGSNMSKQRIPVSVIFHLRAVDRDLSPLSSCSECLDVTIQSGRSRWWKDFGSSVRFRERYYPKTCYFEIQNCSGYCLPTLLQSRLIAWAWCQYHAYRPSSQVG